MFFWDTILYKAIGSFDFLLRILIACLCGALIGLERTKRQKEAGIRTHLIVALGSALLMIISKYAFSDLGISVDASRIASNVVTGVSFLGAGVIFVRGASIKGLTTAAGIWATAAVGLAVGAGMYTLGVFVTLLLVFIQICLHKWFPRDLMTSGELTLRLQQNDRQTLAEIQSKLKELHVIVLSVEMKQSSVTTKEINMEIRMPSNNITQEMLALTEVFPQVTSILI